LKTMADFIIKYRWLIIIGFILVTVIFARQLPKAEIDADLKSQLPKDMVSRINTDKIDELFGGTEMLMVLVKTDDVLNPETLKRVRKLSKQINRVKGVDKVMSLFDLKNIRSEDGAMIVDPAVRRIPKNEEQKEQLKSELKSNDMVYGTVVSKDFSITAIIAVLKTNSKDEIIVPEVEKLLEDFPGDEEIFIGGLPYVRLKIGNNISKDMRRLMPFGLLIMLIFLFACFRQLRGVLLPFFVVIMSILFVMGLIPLIGWKIHIITVLLPVMLIAVANDYGIHMIAKYQEDVSSDKNYSNKTLAKNIFTSLSKPVVLTGLTTMAGMLCLMGHQLIPAEQLGVLAAIGIIYALAASLLFIPSVISLLPRKIPAFLNSETKTNRKPVLERLLEFFGKIVSEKPKTIIVVAIAFMAISSIGIFRIVIDTDPNGYFPDNDPVVQTSNLINENLGGSQNISVVLKGDIKEPRLMNKIDSLESAIGDFQEVGATTSIARVVRQMSRALNDSDEVWYDKIPDNRNAIAQYFELYSMSGDPEDFEKLVDFPYEHAVITARVNTGSTSVIRKLIYRIEEMVRGDKEVLLIGGFGAVLTDLAKLVVNGQLFSLFLATFLVAILLMILFRSFTAGIISAIPLVISITILFGLMGYFGIELNIATAMLSSIMIGVGVDYTIHFLWRYREERENGLVPQAAVNKTLTTTGRGIVFNAFSVIIGFVVLLISSFLPVRFFGFLVVVSIFSCLIGALVLIPALCIVVKPKFLEPKK